MMEDIVGKVVEELQVGIDIDLMAQQAVSNGVQHHVRSVVDTAIHASRARLVRIICYSPTCMHKCLHTASRICYTSGTSLCFPSMMVKVDGMWI